MNPFSKFLRSFANNVEFDAFVAKWDVLEEVVVHVYRDKLSVAEAQQYYDRTWPYLRESYPKWRADLREYWPKTTAAGEMTQVDPFLLLLELPDPEAILNNWTAMQHLPAAREAINRLLIERSED